MQITGGRSERIASLTETSESAPKKKSRKNKQAESKDGEVAELIEQKAGKQGQPQAQPTNAQSQGVKPQGGNPRARPQQLRPQAQVFQWQGQQRLYQTNEEQQSQARTFPKVGFPSQQLEDLSASLHNNGNPNVRQQCQLPAGVTAPSGFSSRVPICSNCHKEGHRLLECPDLQCHRCLGMGHIAKFCSTKPGKQRCCYVCHTPYVTIRNCPKCNSATENQENETAGAQ